MKNSKKGISLIVLVITIIVVIILAAAVIISLQNNNPMSEANRARYSSDAANMQSILVNAIGKAMAYNQEVISIHVDSATTIPTTGDNSGEINFVLGSKSDSTDIAGQIIFDNKPNVEGAVGSQKWYTGKKLPTYKGGTATWSIDTNANLKLTIAGNSYGPGADDQTGAAVTP